METELKRHLLTLVERYRAFVDVSEETVGGRIAGYGSMFQRMRSGRPFTVRTYDSCVGWFSNNWPEGCIWPADISRPAPTPKDV